MKPVYIIHYNGIIIKKMFDSLCDTLIYIVRNGDEKTCYNIYNHLKYHSSWKYNPKSKKWYQVI